MYPLVLRLGQQCRKRFARERVSSGIMRMDEQAAVIAAGREAEEATHNGVYVTSSLSKIFVFSIKNVRPRGRNVWYPNRCDLRDDANYGREYVA